MISSTYRIQLHKDFGFEEVEMQLAYFHELGVSHLYLSPIFEASKSSTHGYDSTDPKKISNERGGEAKLNSLLQNAASANLNFIIDIVPNHMAANSMNPYWMDFLEKGPDSPYSSLFDHFVDFAAGEKLLLPVLGSPPSETIRNHQIRLELNDGTAYFKYFDKIFPLNSKSVALASQKKNANGLIKELLEMQFYELCQWKEAFTRLNYRRFFDINELVAIRVESDDWYDFFHGELFKLMKEYPGIEGLRVDHIDGLATPVHYLNAISKHSKYLWVEKITEREEILSSSWKCQGTTGYDFLNKCNSLFVDPNGLQKLDEFFTRELERKWRHFKDCLLDSKKYVLNTSFQPEIERLSRSSKNFTEQEIVQITASLGVYRTYLHDPESFPHNQRALREVELQRGSQNSDELLKRLENEDQEWISQWEQICGPAMAKGLEDTALYRYYPLSSMNEVGGRPDYSLSDLNDFYEFCKKRSRLSLNASSTHDNKRSEDVRMRLNALSLRADEWIQIFRNWEGKNKKYKIGNIPSSKEQYFIYQNLVGMIGGQPELLESRVLLYFEKAFREAKENTSWLEPQASFEDSLRLFLKSILKDKEFMNEVISYSRSLFATAAQTSLSTICLKFCAPGLPDTYQGTEIWTTDMVDPDNRRPVNYSKLRSLLEKAGTQTWSDLLSEWEDGRIKMHLIHQLMRYRKENPSLFLRGEFIPLVCHGPKAEKLIAFARKFENKLLFVLLPRLVWFKDDLTMKAHFWDETKVHLPATRGRSLLSGRLFEFKDKICPVSEILGSDPLQVFISELK